MDQKTESELLLYSLGIETAEISATSLEKLSTDDWNQFIQQSGKHSTIPLAYNNLKTTGMIAHIPTEIVQKLRKTYLYSAERNIKLHNEFSKVIKILGDNDIPVIALKGSALAELVYQNIALRPMTDVDVIAKTEDIWRMDKVLPQSGYKSDVENILLSKRHIEWARHIVFLNRFILFEVHPKIYELPDLDPWIKAVPAKIASVDTFILGPEDFLLHLCVHLLEHFYVRGDIAKLIWWFDIREVIRQNREGLDWDYVVRIARENQVEKAINRVLHTINEYFNGNVPADILHQLGDDDIVISINDILYGEQMQSQGNDSLLSYIPSISNMKSFRNRIYHIFRSVFPCKEYMIHRYSVKRANFVFLYYPVRMFKAFIRAVKTLFCLPSYLKHRHSSTSSSLKNIE